uniref:Uncharacterized protein n=1 Tax=Meloidogyne enterolobii TaxID=390850 RepID=A0A6V7U861_MELEN|nr:unnamed protein product [Meloidogyne enterolobii]
MSYRKSGPYSDNTSVDDDPLTDDDSKKNEDRIRELERENREYESTVQDYLRQIITLQNSLKKSHGKECAELIKEKCQEVEELLKNKKSLEEDVEHCTTDYNQVMATFAENKRDADKREAKQAETIKQLLSKIELKDREIEKLRKLIPCEGYCQPTGAFLQQNMTHSFIPTTSKDYFVESAISCPLENKTKQGGFFSRLFSRESVVTATWFLGFNTLIVVLFVHVYMFTQRWF